MVAKWSGVLSTTEPRNDIGIIKVRQGNINSEIAEFQIVQNNKPYNLTGLTVFFCASFGLNLVEKPAVVVNAAGGIIEYTFDDDSMQAVGRQKGYFSIKKEESKIDSTQEFEFQVESSLMTRSIDGKSYIYKLSTLIKVLDDFVKNGQKNFNVWFESVKEILYGVDPGGNILRELIEARKNSNGNIFTSLKERLDKNEQETTAQFQQTKTDFEIELARNELNDEQLRAYVDLLQQQVTSMGDISPSPFETLAQLEAAYPNGNNKIYVVNADGNWYYWNSFAVRWVIGGKFQASGIGDKTVSNSKLTDSYSNGVALDGTANFNTLKRTGIYLYTGSPTNCPPGLTSGIIKNDVVDNRWLYQEVKKIGSDSINSKYERIYDTKEGGGGTWKSVSNTNNYKFPYLTTANDLNNVIEEGKWVAISPLNAPYSDNWNVRVERFYTLPDSTSFWGIQTITSNKTGSTFDKYVRNFYKTPTNITFRDWVKVNTAPSQLSGSVVVNFGDSIFGNTQGATSVSSNIANRTGATVHNIGFGGSRIAQHNQYWDSFSLYRLVDEIAKPDSDTTKWKLQDEAITASETGLLNGIPWYFKSTLERLKAIDFSKVNYITISGGTNDYTSNVLLDNLENRYDTATLGGALRYSLEKIMTNFKQLKIMVCSPIYRFWMDESGAFIDDSDTREYNGLTLIDFVEKQREVAKEFKTPFSDNYFELGFNKFNKGLYYPENDGTHPNAEGNKRLGNKIGTDLINKF